MLWLPICSLAPPTAFLSRTPSRMLSDAPPSAVLHRAPLNVLYLLVLSALIGWTSVRHYPRPFGVIYPCTRVGVMYITTLPRSRRITSATRRYIIQVLSGIIYISVFAGRNYMNSCSGNQFIESLQCGADWIVFDHISLDYAYGQYLGSPTISFPFSLDFLCSYCDEC